MLYARLVCASLLLSYSLCAAAAPAPSSASTRVTCSLKGMGSEPALTGGPSGRLVGIGGTGPRNTPRPAVSGPVCPPGLTTPHTTPNTTIHLGK